MKARARHTEGGGGQAGIEIYGPGAPASPSAMPLQHPSGRSPGSQAGVYPGAAPSRAVAQWRSAAPLLAYRCGGSAGIALGLDPRSAPASRFIPSDEGPLGHLKPSHYLRRHARLSMAMTRPPAGLRRDRLTAPTPASPPGMPFCAGPETGCAWSGCTAVRPDPCGRLSLAAKGA